MQLLKAEYKIYSTILFFILLNIFASWAQQSHDLKIRVVDVHGHSLVGATVVHVATGMGKVTNRLGEVDLQVLTGTAAIVRASFLGYVSKTDTLNIWQNNLHVMVLHENTQQLNEVVVSGGKILQNGSSLALQIVDKTFVRANAAGSLMQSLSRLPGVGSMDIGSGQSKPSIRGLGFNRIVVAENGIKHQAQEWGADHGLEIDPYNVERIEITKGPAALMYGANAIGGVIDIMQIATPAKNTKWADFDIYSHSNNALFGLAFKYTEAREKWYFRMFLHAKAYADYKVPVDSITYMTYNIPLKNNRLRNTAGAEMNGGLTGGYVNNNFASHWSFNLNDTKAGFFANAHGLEIRNSAIDYDANMRDIDLPSQEVLHTKVLNNNIIAISDYLLNVDFAFQRNNRKEFSERVAHGFMPLPPDTLERHYLKDTWTAKLKLQLPKHKTHKMSFGANAEIQNNKTAGWGFLLPSFVEKNAGIYVFDEVMLDNVWKLNGGLRYDYVVLQTSDYFDWYATPQNNNTNEYVQRAMAIEKRFDNVSWALGAVAKHENAIWKINVGKSFRTPTAKELASNGINYHMYRYERGDASLSAEISYQLDMQLTLNKAKWQFEISPFANYFPNYIYLNPTALYHEAQQIYNYSESEVFRAGGEMLVDYNLNKQWKFSADIEYIFSQQLSGAKKDYTLPFSPPLRSHWSVNYMPATKAIFVDPTVGLELQAVASQNNIVPPEKKTPGYALLHFSAGTRLVIRNFEAKLNVEIKNILNKRYYDHTSFYRLIEVPGMGRNFMMNVGFQI